MDVSKKYSRRFFDRHRLLGGDKNLWGLPMWVWGVLCSGFISEVLGTLYDPMLPKIPGFMPYACSVHIRLFLKYDMLRVLPSHCTKAVLFLSK